MSEIESPDAGSLDNEALWRAMFTQGSPMPGDRSRNRRIPGQPRCKACLIPLGGLGGRVLRLRGVAPSAMNPNYCNRCELFIRTHPGGAEVELSLLFADVRGSTAIAESMTPGAFSRVLNRFYGASNRSLIDNDAVVDKLVGDEVIGLFPPFFADHPAKAIRAAQDLLTATGHSEPGGPWIPVGVGVHMGRAYVGSVGTREVADITAIGDAVNVTARLSSLAAAGEVLISEYAYQASGLDLGEPQRRRVELKGRAAPMEVRVLRVAADTTA